MFQDLTLLPLFPGSWIYSVPWGKVRCPRESRTRTCQGTSGGCPAALSARALSVYCLPSVLRRVPCLRCPYGKSRLETAELPWQGWPSRESLGTRHRYRRSRCRPTAEQDPYFAYGSSTPLAVSPAYPRRLSCSRNHCAVDSPNRRQFGRTDFHQRGGIPTCPASIICNRSLWNRL